MSGALCTVGGSDSHWAVRERVDRSWRCDGSIMDDQAGKIYYPTSRVARPTPSYSSASDQSSVFIVLDIAQ